MTWFCFKCKAEVVSPEDHMSHCNTTGFQYGRPVTEDHSQGNRLR